MDERGYMRLNNEGVRVQLHGIGSGALFVAIEWLTTNNLSPIQAKPALFGTSFLVCTPFNFLLRSACTCAENNSIHSSFSATTLSKLAPPNIFTAVCLSLSNSPHPSSPFIPCFTLIFIVRRHHHTFAMLRCATSVGVKQYIFGFGSPMGSTDDVFHADGIHNPWIGYRWATPLSHQ